MATGKPTIITAVGSTAHVTDIDQQAINRSMLGNGNYVFSHLGNALEAVIASNNEIVIKDGVFCCAGIYGRLKPGETNSVDIENGTSGMNRNDLICLRFSRTGSIGEYDWVVLKGEAVNGTAKDPAYTVGDTLNGDTVVDFPMFRVSIEGLSIKTVTTLFTMYDGKKKSSGESTTVELTDSKDTTQFKTWPLSIKKVNGIVYAKYKGIHNMRANQKVSFTGTIPKAYRPETDECVSVTTINNNKPSGHCMFDFTSAGKVSVISNVSGTQEVRFSTSWPEKEV